MKFITTLTILLMILITAHPVRAQHSDIRPRVEGGKIVTDGFVDATITTEPNVSVFGYDFGENVDDPFFVQDPGLNAASGSGLTAGAGLSFNLLSGLSFWNGAGGVSFAPVATGETLDLNFGLQTRALSGASSAQTGFTIQTIGAGGTVHRHLNAFLKGSDGNTIPAGPGTWGAGDGVQAANGIYLFSMELLEDPTGSVAKSNPIFIVFNNGLNEVVHDQAIQWVEANLVPEPAWLGPIAVGVIGLLWNRRRRRRLSIDLP